MNVTVRLFAILRERAGSDSIELRVSDGATVADAIEALREQPGLADVVTRMPLAMAVNREYAPPQTRLRAGDELALIPPVSGGAAREQDVHASVTEHALEDLSRLVVRPGAGALVSFQGITRDVERLDYEAYREMAEQKIRAILLECVERHGLAAAAASHRVGSVPRGEASIMVAVSAAHRGEAFAGAREAIDRIKAEAPIWKEEIDGSAKRRVEGTAAPGASAPAMRGQAR